MAAAATTRKTSSHSEPAAAYTLLCSRMLRIACMRQRPMFNLHHDTAPKINRHHTITSITTKRFFGGMGFHFNFGGEHGEPETPKGESVLVELEVTLRDLYLGAHYKVQAMRALNMLALCFAVYMYSKCCRAHLPKRAALCYPAFPNSCRLSHNNAIAADHTG